MTDRQYHNRTQRIQSELSSEPNQTTRVLLPRRVRGESRSIKSSLKFKACVAQIKEIIAKLNVAWSKEMSRGQNQCCDLILQMGRGVRLM